MIKTLNNLVLFFLLTISIACGNDASGIDGGSESLPIDAVQIDSNSGSAGCATENVERGVVRKSMTIRGVERSYLLSIPSAETGKGPFPLVFGWHGRGSNGAQAKSYFGIEEASGMSIIAVYPDGLMQEQGTGWNLYANGEDIEYFDELLKYISENYCVDPRKVFSTGHSFGGYMSNELGCLRSDVLRAIAPVAGGGPIAATSCSSPKVASWLVHGSLDTVVTVDRGKYSRDFWLSRNGCGAEYSPVSPEPCVQYEGCDELVLWCEHNESVFYGHGWPTFVAQGIWTFFSSLEPKGQR